MALEPPRPGQVIHYSYLWWNEARRERIEGRKDRPCCVVLTRTTREGVTVVYVLPVTHGAPREPEAGVEVPPATKRRLGLDSARSWIILRVSLLAQSITPVLRDVRTSVAADTRQLRADASELCYIKSQPTADEKILRGLGVSSDPAPG